PGLRNPRAGVAVRLVGGVAGEPSRLAPGSVGQVLTMNGTPGWKAIPNPFPTSQPGAVLRYLTASTVEALIPGANTQVLTIVSGLPTWASLPGSTIPAGNAGSLLHYAGTNVLG